MTTQELSRGRPDVRMRIAPVSLAFAYIGAGLVLQQWIHVWVGPVSAFLLVAVALGVIGWTRLPVVQFRAADALRRATGLGGVLVATATFSAVWAWSPGAGFEAVALGLWLLVILPGMAVLLREPRNRQALVAGLVAAVGTYLVVAMMQLATGEPIAIDGVNRNRVSREVLTVMPLLAAGILPRFMKPARWPAVAAGLAWLLLSGNRSGLLGVPVIALVYVVLQPGASRRLRLAGGIGFVALVLFAVASQPSEPALYSLDRVTATFDASEETSADEGRRLLLRKAWHLGLENPVLGIGLGRFQDTYHPVIEEASTGRAYEIASGFLAHNTYAEVWAATGVPGTLGLIGMLGAVTWAGVTSRRRDSAGATTALVATMFMIAFESALSPPLYVMLALVLGTSWQPDGQEP